MALRFLRGVLSAIGLALIAIGGTFLFGLPQIEDVSRRGFESQLTEFFGTEVTAQSMRVDPFRRAFILNDVMLSNPEGFRREAAITCERLLVKIEPVTFLTTEPTISRILAEGVFVDYRYKAGHGTNIAQLLDSVEAYQAANEGGRAYRVDLLEVPDANVRFSTNLIPVAGIGTRVVTIQVDDVHDGKGLSTPQIAQIFVRSLVKQAVTLGGIADPVLDAFKDAFTRGDSDA